MDAVIVGNSGTILKTTDGGNNWIQNLVVLLLHCLK